MFTSVERTVSGCAGCAGGESISGPNTFCSVGWTGVGCHANTAMWPDQSNGNSFWDSVVNTVDIHLKSASVTASTVAFSFCSSLNGSPAWMVIAGDADDLYCGDAE